MARKSKKTAIVAMPTEGEALLIAEHKTAVAELVADAIAEVEADHAADHEGPSAPRGRSVVPLGYKKKYATRAVTAGQTSKAAKRQCSDWLALELLAECVPDGKTFALNRFLDILEANGVKDPLDRWPSRTNGWEGRIRMSGGVLLRGIVAKSGEFRTPEATVRLAEIPEAASFLAKWDGRNS
jgi:hypothetical protein